MEQNPMNRNNLIGLALALTALGLLVFAAYSLFELFPRTRQIPPSREARVNQYLALDRWLQKHGIQVRTESSGNLSMISRAEERRIFIQTSLFRWSDEAVKYLVRWIEEGGTLFLVLDRMPAQTDRMSTQWHDEEPIIFLEKFGIEARAGAAMANHGVYRLSAELPNFDRRVSFYVEGDEALTLKDGFGLTRLVQLNHGKGTLIVSGQPRFLLSGALDRTPNARLAWAIFAGNENEGWLFIRGATRVRGLLGTLFREGNLTVLLVSIFVLLVVSFWAVIPMFGLVRGDDEKPGKPLRERFLAEGRFLKKYGALGLYCQVYIKEIKRRLARKEGLCEDDEILGRVLDIYGKTASVKSGNPLQGQDLLDKVFCGEPVGYREFPKVINIFRTILERI